jgi:hypothetical protein
MVESLRIQSMRFDWMKAKRWRRVLGMRLRYCPGSGRRFTDETVPIFGRHFGNK